MMKHFRSWQHNQFIRTLLRHPLATFLGVLIVMVLLLFVSASFMNIVTRYVVHPLWSVTHAVEEEVRTRIATITKSKEELAEENVSLLEERADLKARIRILEDRLAELESRDSAARGDFVVRADVTARPPWSPYDTMIIDAGYARGIREGDEAYTAGGVYVGFVVSVREHDATVRLLSSPGTVIRGRIGTTGLDVELEGQGGGQFEFVVPVDTEMIADGTLVRSSTDPLVGYGYVVESRTAEDDVFTHVVVRSLVPLNTIRYVDIYR